MRDVINYFAIQFKLDPDDLHQEIEEKLLRTKRMYTPGTATYKTWLQYVVKNHCIDITRRKENQQKFYTIKVHHGGNASPDYHSRQYIASLMFKVRRRWPKQRKMNTRLLWMLMTGWKFAILLNSLFHFPILLSLRFLFLVCVLSHGVACFSFV
jgi:hypothetical protein